MLATARPSCFTIVGGTAKHCVDQYMVLFAKGDTAMPGGLHAVLCHAFLVKVEMRGGSVACSPPVRAVSPPNERS